jgi:hypothetical protein
MTYPDGYVVNYNYSSGLNDTISRLSSLSGGSEKFRNQPLPIIDAALTQPCSPLAGQGPILRSAVIS